MNLLFLGGMGAKKVFLIVVMTQFDKLLQKQRAFNYVKPGIYF